MTSCSRIQFGGLTSRWLSADQEGVKQTSHNVDLFQARLDEIKAAETQRTGRRHLWFTHHWPENYHTHCVKIRSTHVCRRCLALHPLAITIAVLFALGFGLWPSSVDPWPIWILSIPPTIAFAGASLGLFPYIPRWQTATSLLAAVAFGRALGYELTDRWHPYFWGPLAVFSGIWFFTSWWGYRSA